MSRNPGRARTHPRRLPMRSKNGAPKNCLPLELRRRGWRTSAMRGPVFLRNCFAFIATFVQNTRVPDATRQPRAVPHPDLSPSRSRGDPQVVLRDGISGRADRSGLRRSTTVCRFSYYLLHRPRTGIVFRARNRWGDRRLSARLAPAIAEPALLFFAKHHPVLSRLAAVSPLSLAFAPFYSLAVDVRLAGSPGGAATRAAFSH